MMERSLAASLVVKATFVLAMSLMVVFLPARRSRASLRHTFLASSDTPVAVAMPDDITPGSSRSPEFSPSALLFAGWLLGVIVFLLPVAAGLRQLRSLRRTAIPWRHGQTVAAALARDAGIHRHVEVLLDTVSGPTTFGVMHSVILLPVDAENWDADDLNRALVHELEHVRRGDWMSHCLARVVCSMYWFHPLAWMAWRQFALDAERACDDAVLGVAEPTAYADQLVGLARRLSALRKSPGLAMASRADLTARVGAVLDGRQRRGRAGALSVALAWIAAAMLLAAVSPLLIVAAPQVAIPVPVGLPIAMPPIVLAQLAAPPAPAPPAAVTGKMRFTANSTLITVDLTLKDQSGKVIEGLHADDFVLTEDGKAQAIGIFEFQQLFAQDGLHTTDLSYYILGYYTTNGNPDGSYRRISVVVKNNPAAKLDYRAGYYGSTAPASAGANAAIANDVTGPFVVSKVDPEYSEEARKAKYSGTVVLRVDVNTSGQVTHATVTRSLGMGLDQKAIEAVTKWTFIPAKKEGKPVDSQSEVSMNFRLL
jgi:TonB family protein